MCVCVCLCVDVCICVCVCGCVCVCVCVSIHPSHPSILTASQPSIHPSIHPPIHPSIHSSNVVYMRNRLHQTMRLFLRACSKDLFYSCWFGIGLHYYLYLHTTLRLVRMQWRRKLQGQGPRWVPMEPDAGAMGHGPEMFQTFNQQHNPLQKFGKIAKTYGALRQGLRWAPTGPDGPDGPAA